LGALQQLRGRGAGAAGTGEHAAGDEKASGAEKRRFPLLATYELALKCSNLFNLLDARGAISVTERVGVIGRIRALAVGVAKAYAAQQPPSAIESAEQREIWRIFVGDWAGRSSRAHDCRGRGRAGRRVNELLTRERLLGDPRRSDHVFDAAPAGGAGGRRADGAGRPKSS
jgi:hypothetical protein